MTSPQPPFPTSRFLAPRFWPTWLMLALLWLVARLPHWLRLKVGFGFGRLLLRLWSRRRHIAEVNLQLCFPELSEAERATLLRRHFESVGMMVVEMAMGWWLPESRLAGMADFDGVEYLEEARQKGEPVIVLGAHWSTIDITARLVSRVADFNVMYRESKNPLVDELMRRARERCFDRAIPRDDIRGMLRSIKRGKPVWYAPDQNYGREHSVFVPFFGVPAATITATTRLAKMSGAKLIPLVHHRLPDGRYHIYFLPPLEHFPGADPTEDAARVNALIESLVRKAPEQYLWLHRRFKTRPEGEPGVY